ncbi:hypothetical protein [Rubrivirga sp.]|uniref:hypothetical protein n=1 Tax=Rubrivirga sp. TaxID=1885344 RepID=UPI003C7150EF
MTEEVAVEAGREAVVLHIRGERIELQPGEAFLVGEALSRIGDEVAVNIGRPLPLPRGGDRCEPSQGEKAGQGFVVFGGYVFDKCPPRPRPARGFTPEDLDFLHGGRVKVIGDPGNLDWEPIAGGFRARY